MLSNDIVPLLEDMQEVSPHMVWSIHLTDGDVCDLSSSVDSPGLGVCSPCVMAHVLQLGGEVYNLVLRQFKVEKSSG